MKKQQISPAQATVLVIYQRIFQAVNYLKKLIGRRKHEILIVLGSGLGESIKNLTKVKTIKYAKIPNWPTTNAPGHKGVLISAKLGNKWVLIMQGRPHAYEGYSFEQIAFPIRVAYELGIKLMIITNAAGGLKHTGLKPGDIMLIKDHINLMGGNSLVGANLERYGKRFPGMMEVYDQELLEKMRAVAVDMGIWLKPGIFTAILGPPYETPAEMAMLKILGVSASGMSTVQEAITAAHCTKMGVFRVVGMSVITDIMNPEHPEPVDEDMVIAEAKKVSPKIGKIITAFVRQLP